MCPIQSAFLRFEKIGKEPYHSSMTGAKGLRLNLLLPLFCPGKPHQGNVARRLLWTALMGSASYFSQNDDASGSSYAGVVPHNLKVLHLPSAILRTIRMGHSAPFFGTHVLSLEALKTMNNLTRPPVFYCLANFGAEYSVYAMPESLDPVMLNPVKLPGPFWVRFLDTRADAFFGKQRIEAGVQLELPTPSDVD